MLMFVLYFEAAKEVYHLILSKTFLTRSVDIVPYCDVITTCNIFILQWLFSSPNLYCLEMI